MNVCNVKLNFTVFCFTFLFSLNSLAKDNSVTTIMCKQTPIVENSEDSATNRRYIEINESKKIAHVTNLYSDQKLLATTKRWDSRLIILEWENLAPSEFYRPAPEWPSKELIEVRGMTSMTIDRISGEYSMNLYPMSGGKILTDEETQRFVSKSPNPFFMDLAVLSRLSYAGKCIPAKKMF